MKPLLTVLLPNYNNEPYLEECLDSLMRQSFKDFQVYFIDDCSTDKSLDVLARYNDPRIHLLRKDQNSGIVDTLNLGLEKINTKYYVRMDGDDRMPKNRFELLVNFMESHREIDVCGSAIKTFGIREDLQIYPTNQDLNRANLIVGHSIGHASCIFRTETIKRHEIHYQNEFWRLEDYHLFYQLNKIANTTSLKVPLYLYRQESYNVNEAIEDKKQAEYRRFYKMILNDMGLEGTEKQLDIHMQLANRTPITENLLVFDQHIDQLIKANAESKLFPVKALKLVLKKKRLSIIYQLMDQRKLGVGQIISEGLKNWGIFQYFIGTRLKK